MERGDDTSRCGAFALVLALSASVSSAELSFSRIALDATQLSAQVSYPSSMIQSRWEVYGLPSTGGWLRVAADLVLTGSVATSWSPSSNVYRMLALGQRDLDTDDDGLDDAYEQLVSRTSLSSTDTDGDGVFDGDEVATDPLDALSHATQTMLRAVGTRIVDAAAAPVSLRGVNIGGWLVYEQWMVGYRPLSGSWAQDDYNVRATLDSRFGTTGTTYLLELYRDHYFTTHEMDDLKAAGYNCLRIPFLANLLEDETNTYVYKQSGWDRLDWVVSNCAARKIYCLLDLHGVQGCQNPWDHSGRIGYNQVWYNTGYQARAVALWSAIAQRYATNAAVAGYDLMNEPYAPVPDQQGFVATNLIPLYDRLYDAIRAYDTGHIVFIESTEQFVGSNNAAWWMPNPSTMGWANVVYEFHNYDGVIGDNDFSFTYQKSVADKLVRRYVDFGSAYQVPVLVGEFNAIRAQNMDYFFRHYTANGIHWTHWSYKHIGDWADLAQPWSAWGLFYSQLGLLPSELPDIVSDSWAELVEDFGHYDYQLTGTNAHLYDVARRNGRHPEEATEKTEYYANTFTAHGQDNRASPDDAWPWLKVAASVANDYAYVLTNHRGRLLANWNTNVQMRLKSRVEADARFEVADSTGSWFSVELHAMGLRSGVQLAALRDAVTGAAWWASSPGLIARGISSNGFRLELWAKRDSAPGFGTNLFTSAGMTFVTGAVLALHVNATNAVLQYNGTSAYSTAHGFNFGAWPNGAACIVECDNLSGGSIAQTSVELDNLKAWRPGAPWSGRFDDAFTGRPDLLPLLAAPERWSVNDFGGVASNENAVFQGGKVLVIPKREDWGITWLDPRRDYANDLRYSATGQAALEFRATFSRYTNGAVKLSWMPEYMPRETYWLYDAPYLFAEIRDKPGGQLLFHIFRQQKVADLVSCASNFVSYTDGKCFSFQVSTQQAAIYYGTNL
ncbi:MAG TPA: cellulase family glycosylhydrolase, partial [Kiritimatiellia bacterium]